MNLAKYLKVAFLNRWNLLAMAGGLAFAFISGHPDIVAPLLLAGEVTYLGLLGTHPKFQKYVDAHQTREMRSKQAESKEQVVKHIVGSLPRDARDRFDNLRRRCRDLRQLANDLKEPGRTDRGTLESLQVQGLDRLLWVFLRLLFTQHSLSRFLQETDATKISKDISRIETRLAKLDEKPPGAANQRIRRTLEDNLSTCQNRLANYQKAENNLEFVELEIDRLENKIKSIAEVSINRQEPDYVSSQIDQVASSMLETEQTINELDFATGLGELDDQVPELLEPTMQSQL